MKKLGMFIVGMLYAGHSLLAQADNNTLLSQAQKGDRNAQYSVAQTYFDQNNYQQARFWYQKAEQQRVADIILLDGLYFQYQAYNKYEGFTNKNHEPSGAIYGVIKIIDKLRTQFPDALLVVALDTAFKSDDFTSWSNYYTRSGKSSRQQDNKNYKSTRQATSTKLFYQTPFIWGTLHDRGIPIIHQKYIEADDIIATLSRQAQEHGFKVVICSGDKDFNQLVTDNVAIYNPIFDRYSTTQEIKRFYGVSPKRFLDYLTLMGDKADNVPGITGINKNMAKDWLQQYGSLDGIIKNKHFLEGKAGQSFRKSADKIRHYQSLLKLNDHVKLDTHWGHVMQQSSKPELLLATYQRFNFKLLKKAYEVSAGLKQPSSLAMKQAQYHLGWMHEKGLGGDKNNMKAKQWYEKSARKGNKEAQFSLARLYEKQGELNDAYHWYQAASKQGHAKAQQFFSQLLMMKNDYVNAEYWGRQAAKQDNVDAQYALAKLYQKNALYWFNKASMKGHEKAKKVLQALPIVSD